ncbi:MAG: AtpZ/AtpI family protein [Rickettsiales bacterium]
MANNDDLPPLGDLQKKIAKARHESPEAKAERALNQAGNNVALRGGTELIAGIAVGGFLGYHADQWLDTRPALLILGIFVGMAGGVMNIYRAVSSESAQIDDVNAAGPAGSCESDDNKKAGD